MMDCGKQVMTWDRLCQYRDLCAEVTRLERGKAVQVCDTVKGSSKYFPYQERIFVVSGVVSRRSTRLAAAKRKRDAEKAEIESFVDQIEDQQMRDVIAARYLAGMSWSEVARLVGGGNTGDGVRMAVKRFFRAR